MTNHENSFFKRFSPVLLIILLGLVFFAYFRDYMSLDVLRQYHQPLTIWAQQHYHLAVICYMSVYIVMIAISFPASALLTLAGGFLFGPFWGAFYAVISATTGAAILFVAIKVAFADTIAEKGGIFLQKLEKGFEESAFSYILILRLIPLFPFWLTNIIPALLNANSRSYIIATFLGIIPTSLVYAFVGSDLASTFALGQDPDLGMIFKPIVLLPILGLAILALIPIIYRQFKHSE